MATHPYSKEAHARANARYLDKTYRQIPIRFKKEDDKDILDALEKAKVDGISYRQWVRQLYDAYYKK